jgi:4-hydroxybenzoate polyprenyltransferase
MSAALLGTVLLAGGVLCAVLAGWLRGESTGWATPSAIVALFLAGAILLYDGWLKRTWAGPLGMGACRFLNVLLGLSVAGAPPWPWGWHLALIVGLYIVGVTWFARTEARESNREMLALATVVMLASLVLALPLAAQAGDSETSPLFPYLLVALGFLIGVPAWRAVADPTPSRVQPAVKRAIFALVLLDATLAAALAGTPALLLALLVLPAMFLGRWIYST